ncbi:hypothetical protein A2773_07025 [Candidatus Gottesmanbacteria bacterium RIFCSPHIGHO2_01_FULL_39_10]|uniref:Uncharacterized protein n=1 Tax=Candidatus Gottesmanbacteria bacterium RIFCSPHIGHO2_01_FULL_39_10 TaxID=1798375 RepID=A0A1F5ZR58_9BACT|nr:MAG: hypothetical protein A2773_07025 [Candidatus Gottesmanbacteria bacterium RIFCSPHIGHO2_01_FULL_39_10]
MMNNWQSFMPMMAGYGYGGTQCAALEGVVKSPVFTLMMLFYLATWVLVLAVLVALLRYLWRKGGK